eukprot:TRINITY_DN19794_c0_g1_i2.p1 TRINITY_DN19794_c0_g1~~TRINITY_DN19794_c0_g1_i2.p1  ORF type:complete len:372 (-),score=29.74 TRINITY_DN19794_c0_g1_i2:620-1735(-)
MKDYTTHYMGMSKNMREVYAIPLVDLQNLMGQNTDFSRVLFVFKVGRCGSTLMTNLLDKAVGLCESHSEPFIFTQLLLLLSNKELEEKKCSQFLRASVWVFVQGAQKRLSTKNPLVVLSPQGIGHLTQVLLEKSIPEAKATFIYRNPIQVIDSFLSASIQLMPSVTFFRSTGLLQWILPLAGNPAFQFQSNYKKSMVTASQEAVRYLIHYNEDFLNQLVQPGQNIIDYAVRQYYYMLIGPHTMHAYGALYAMQKMYKMGLIKCSVLYDDFVKDAKNTFLKLGEILDLKDELSEENIDGVIIEKLCRVNNHEFFVSGRNLDYDNYDHFEGNRVKCISKNEIEWTKNTFEQFKQLTGLVDYIIDGTIHSKNYK